MSGIMQCPEPGVHLPHTWYAPDPNGNKQVQYWCPGVTSKHGR